MPINEPNFDPTYVVDYGDILETYKQLHGETPYVKHKLERLEKFKNKEVPAIFEQLAKLKTEDL